MDKMRMEIETKCRYAKATVDLMSSEILYLVQKLNSDGLETGPEMKVRDRAMKLISSHLDMFMNHYGMCGVISGHAKAKFPKDTPLDCKKCEVVTGYLEVIEKYKETHK